MFKCSWMCVSVLFNTSVLLWHSCTR